MPRQMKASATGVPGVSGRAGSRPIPDAAAIEQEEAVIR